LIKTVRYSQFTNCRWHLWTHA